MSAFSAAAATTATRCSWIPASLRASARRRWPTSARTDREEVGMTHHEHKPLAGKRAAVMIGPLFEDVEAVYPYYRLQEAGASVGLVGIAGGETVKGKKKNAPTTD